MAFVVLVVDDSMLIRHTVCRFLEERGFVVESATNGEDALETLRRIRPHLIVTDMQMPRMGGGELIAALKTMPHTTDIPVVILASRQSGLSETVSHTVIYKDIDIEEQLGKAIQSVFGDVMNTRASGAGN